LPPQERDPPPLCSRFLKCLYFVEVVELLEDSVSFCSDGFS
jgi:hypothetical protein